MRITVHQIDAFTRRPFAGNPAAVCPLASWPADALLGAIAAERNVSETAFFVPYGGDFHLRWFTPVTEVPLCGHATLATAWLILRRLEPARERVRFHTRSGWLAVTRDGDRLVLDLPALPVTTEHDPAMVADALGVTPLEVWEADRGLALLASADDVRALAPDLARVAALPFPGIAVTARGDGDADFVSRYFAPRRGVPEDPVTGAAHCTLAPFWARRLGRRRLFARQLSRRGGELWVEDCGARVRLAGHCAPVLEGALRV